jgi:hypothetical protein
VFTVPASQVTVLDVASNIGEHKIIRLCILMIKII